MWPRKHIATGGRKELWKAGEDCHVSSCPGHLGFNSAGNSYKQATQELAHLGAGESGHTPHQALLRATNSIIPHAGGAAAVLAQGML